jgi:hypothetical protein
MPRLYIYSRGGFIRAEIAVTESEWGQVRAGLCPPDGVLDISLNEHSEALERDELLAVSTRRRAPLAGRLETTTRSRWRRSSDGLRSSSRQSVREHAALGCHQAQGLVAAGIPAEEARLFGAEHVCGAVARSLRSRRAGLETSESPEPVHIASEVRGAEQ